MTVRAAFRRWSLLCLVLVSGSAACSRREPGPERQSPSAAASASAGVAVAVSPKRKRDEPGPPAPPPKPAVTPSVPPQLVACGSGRDFYRITDKALEVFEVSKKIPPPQVRGSAAALQTAAVAMAEPLNVISVARDGVLVIGKQNVFRYVPGSKSARASAPIPTPGPLVAWSDPARSGSFWVRVAGEKSLRSYTPAAAPKAAPSQREQALPDFDARLFTVLSDGTPFYSTPKGLVRAGDEAEAAAVPRPSEPATLVFADAVADRFWAADARGNLGLWQRKQEGAPVFSASVPGAVIDVAVEGERVAVLSVDVVDQNYRPTVTVFSDGKQKAQQRVSGTPAADGPPKLDLCLIPGRPWVVVGGTRWMQLVDWETPRLLSEW